MLDRLAALARRAIAVDLPTGDLPPGPMLPQLDAFAAALVRGWARRREVVVVGNSLGGAVALRLAERADLPLAGVVPGLDMPRWLDVIERDALVRALVALPLPRPALLATIAEVYRRLAFSAPHAADQAAVQAFATAHATRDGLSRLLDSGRRLLPELATPPFDFAAIACPVLLVWGTRDRMCPHRGARVLSEALPGARVELLDGCGHCPQLEAPERLAELLAGFPDPARAAA